jgi:hypothetical protein
MLMGFGQSAHGDENLKRRKQIFQENLLIVKFELHKMYIKYRLLFSSPHDYIK